MSKKGHIAWLIIGLLVCSANFAANNKPVKNPSLSHSANTQGLHFPWTSAQMNALFDTIITSMNKPETNWWATREFSLWWTKSNPSPPLVIAGQLPQPIAQTFTSPPPSGSGYLGFLTVTNAPNTLTIDNATNVLAGNNIKMPPHSGGHFTLGRWINNDKSLGLEGDVLFLGNSIANFKSSNRILGIPYFDAKNGLPTSYPVYQPALATTTSVYINNTPTSSIHLFDSRASDAYFGNVAAHSASTLQTAALNAVWRAPFAASWRPQVISGMRFFRLSENMKLSSNVLHPHTDTTTFDSGLGIPPPTTVINSSSTFQTRRDYFSAINNFYGLQLGARGEYQWGHWAISGSSLAGLGVMLEQVIISGNSNFSMLRTTTPTTTTSVSGIPLTIASGAPAITIASTGTTNSGLFAQPSNSGHHKRTTTSAMLQGELNGHYYFTRNLYASLGYTFLYMSTVALPGKQIDRHLNPTQLNLPPPTSASVRPAFHLHSSSFWAQGLNVGINYRF